jgi:ribosomal protein S18 acetylase RimI-like enzyme/DNA-binding MarR family transcriptional regulator
MTILADLKEMALASRLRHLSDRLMEDADGLYRELGIPFRPRWFPVFHALGRAAPWGVTELAQTLGITHPAVSQVAAQLKTAGLATEARDAADERLRRLKLTPKGRRLRRRLEPVWDAFRVSAGELLTESRVDLLRDLDRIEAVHERSSVVDRARRRLALPARRRLEIVDYRPAYKKHFRALNEEWMCGKFAVETHDARLLGDPMQRIVARGGRVLFALMDGEVAATCALVRYPGALVELVKMAVAPERRGKGIGTELARAAIARARAMGAPTLFLQTSPEMKDAIRFYRRLGFRRARALPLPRPAYARESITLALRLRPVAQAAEERSSS